MIRILRHHLKTLSRLLYTAYFYLIFFSVTSLYYFWGYMFLHRKAPQEWRDLALRAIDMIFFLARIRPHITGLEHLPETPVILSSNHQSYLDGFIIFYATRIPFVAITAPLEEFPRFISRWFTRSGYLSISRDEFEEVYYKEEIRRNEIVALAIEELARGNSILIFPEGRRARTHRMHPFHNGVARIAFGSKAPVVPIVLKHVDYFFPVRRHVIIPCAMQIEIKKSVALHEQFAEPNTATAYLQDLTARELPPYYIPTESLAFDPATVRAVFFDLDGTLTRHNLSRLMAEHYVLRHPHLEVGSRITRLIFKKLFLKHTRFYRRSIALLEGMSVSEFHAILEDMLRSDHGKIFYTEMLELLQLHKKHGDLVFVITEEPGALIEPIAQFLGVPVFATEIETSGDTITGKVIGPIVKDEHKKEIVERLAEAYHIDLHRSSAYGNSWHDYDMLRAVGHATLINPCRTLAAHGEGLGFRIVG